MKKKPKNLNLTPTGKKSKLTVIDYYKDLFTHMTIPVSEAFINRLSDDLLSWANNDPEAFKLTQFIRKVGMHSKTFYRWCNTYPTLGDAKKAALEAIGDRRELGALKNKLNTQMVMRQQHFYDEEWWNSEVKRAHLHAQARAEAQRNQESNINYTIVLDDYSEKEKEKEKKSIIKESAEEL